MPDERLARLVDAVTSLGGDLGLKPTLQRVVEAALDLVGARYGALGVIDQGDTGDRPEGERRILSSFVHAGMEDAIVAQIGSLPEGHGILGLLIEHPRIVRLADLTQHPASTGFPPGHPTMGSFLGAPVRVHDLVFGNLYLTEKRGADEFTPGDEELVSALAAIAGAAIANAELFAQVRRLEVVEDRERIGRDLHDTVIQRLFATGLSLQAVARHVDEVPKAVALLNHAMDDLDDTVKEIRAVIFSLQDAGSSTGLRARVMALCDELGRALRKAPRVRFEGPVDLVTSTAIAKHATAVLREALTNVVKHARATKVQVAVRATAAELELTVTDDGVGLPTAVRSGALGLQNLRNRASDLGGFCEVESIQDADTGSGTRVRWVVPL